MRGIGGSQVAAMSAAAVSKNHTARHGYFTRIFQSTQRMEKMMPHTGSIWSELTKELCMRAAYDDSWSEENLRAVIETPQRPKTTIADTPSTVEPLALPFGAPEVPEDEKEEPKAEPEEDEEMQVEPSEKKMTPRVRRRAHASGSRTLGSAAHGERTPQR